MRKVAVEFSAEERGHYNELAEETQQENDSEQQGTAFLLTKLKRLQMACNHPSLQAARAAQQQQCQHQDGDKSTCQCSMCGKPAAYRLPCSHLFCVDGQARSLSSMAPLLCCHIIPRKF